LRTARGRSESHANPPARTILVRTKHNGNVWADPTKAKKPHPDDRSTWKIPCYPEPGGNRKKKPACWVSFAEIEKDLANA